MGAMGVKARTYLKKVFEPNPPEADTLSAFAEATA